jgi:diamine N-acetyltransferase
MTPKGEFRIRPAGPEDAGLVLDFIRALAEHEGARDRCTATPEMIRDSLFGPDRRAEAVVGHLGGEPAAFAVFFPNFSTYRGRSGLYLEDLFVRPEHRGAGLGRYLLAYLASVALRRGWFRLDWTALAGNESAFAFYSRLGAELERDRRSFHLEGEGLHRLAGQIAVDRIP